MKVDEYHILERAFEESFGFMLNRIWELYDLPGDPHEHRSAGVKDLAEERCFSEFLVALESDGVELEVKEVPLRSNLYK